MFCLPIFVAALFPIQDPPKPVEPPAAPPQAAPAGELVLNVQTLTRLLPDGVTLTADHHTIPFAMETRPTFVCFHMEGGSRAEFAVIAKRFGEFACSTLAVDLRTGKTAGGVENQTALSAAKTLSRTEFKNEEAFVDVVEALKWARELAPETKIFALGSGTSAALVLAAAARDPACADAVFVFSPGEDVPGWSIAMEAKQIKVPVYLTCDGTPQEAGRARLIGNAIDKKLRTMVIPTGSTSVQRGAGVLVQPEIALRDRHWSGVVRLILQLAPLSTQPAAPPGKD